MISNIIVWGDSIGQAKQDVIIDEPPVIIDPPVISNGGVITTGDPLMAATKARTSLFSSLVLVTGASDTASSVVDLSGGYGALVDIVVTNTAGPTVPAAAQLWVATDYNAGNPTLFTKFGGALTASAATSAVTYFSVEIPLPAAAMKITAGSNTVNAVAISADISNVTAI